MDGNNVEYTYHPGGRIESITDGTGHRKLGYDALGNLVHEDRYIAIPNSDNALAFHTAYTYDSWGRMRTLRYPDGEQVTYTYRWGGDLFSVHGTKGAVPYRYIDSIAHNAVGQLTKSTDPEGNRTVHLYDLAGRRTARIHPSAGTTRWDYDAAGNILRMTQNDGQWMEYSYHYNRPVHIHYSHRPWNDVWYRYGAPGTGNQAGRLVRQQDATGVQEFEYDRMGNLIFNRHTYVQPHSPNTFTLETHWKYDSWGRIRNITYPDKEFVVYFYDHGGNLQHIKGRKGLAETEYIKDIHYDRFGQRTYTRYDNRIETHYTYDSLTRRLTRMYNIAPNGTLLQDNRYTYDPVGNITAIDDNGLNPRRQVYEYDPADRLRLSEGHMGDLEINYHSEYDYSPAGKIMRKHTHGKRMNNYGTFPVDYTNEYHYPTAGNPFAVEKIESHGFGAYELLWDKNGNMTHSFSPRAGERRLCWTEDNRMQAYWEQGNEDGIAAYYNYTAGGERNFKLTSPRISMSQNAFTFNTVQSVPSLVYPTLYASPLITLTKHGYTKHYFEGMNRICSKLGGGFDDGLLGEIEDTVPALACNYVQQSKRQNEGANRTFADCLGMGAEVDGKYDLYKVVVRETERDEKEPAFYYHSDHLGSAAYLTNDDGKVTQALNYLPYGEDWVDVRYDLDPRLGQYTFNGKEKDHESGFHYYGARYYWSELLTGWLSVDPMADKYPSISPYAYCAWNPVNLVDPDGQEVEYSSFQDRCYVLAARILSKGFRMRYNDLKDSKEVYVFNHNDKGDNKLSTDGDKLYINYSLGEAEKKEGATVISLLRHETEHAVQFEYGEVGFQKDENGRWRTLNFDINDEIKARDFEASSSIILNSRSTHSIWGRKDERLETREQQIDYLRGAGYKAPDAVMNNTSADVGKDGTKFALQHRKRTY